LSVSTIDVLFIIYIIAGDINFHVTKAKWAKL